MKIIVNFSPAFKWVEMMGSHVERTGFKLKVGQSCSH